MEDFHHMCFEILDYELISTGCLWEYHVRGLKVCPYGAALSRRIYQVLPVSVAQANVYDNYPAWGFPDHVGYRNINPRPSWVFSACGYKASEENFYPIQITGRCEDSFFSIYSFTSCEALKRFRFMQRHQLQPLTL